MAAKCAGVEQHGGGGGGKVQQQEHGDHRHHSQERQDRGEGEREEGRREYLSYCDCTRAQRSGGRGKKETEPSCCNIAGWLDCR